MLQLFIYHFYRFVCHETADGQRQICQYFALKGNGKATSIFDHTITCKDHVFVCNSGDDKIVGIVSDAGGYGTFL